MTISRDDAVQRWPVEKKAPLTAQSTAVFMSASSSTISGFLPPISSWNLRIREAQAAATLRPVSTEPVKVTASTLGWSSSAWPTVDPRPMTRLKTPAGRPASAMISASACAEAVARSAGLNTTVLP